MKASVGDHVVVRGTHVDDHVRAGEVVEVRSADGAPPYLVRWEDGHTGLLFPGPDVSVEHHPADGET